MNFISKLISKLKSQESLYGEWMTEDGSGFSMISGSWIKFEKDGKGSYESWHNGTEEDSYVFKGDFLWEKTGDFQIKIYEKNKPDKIIDYQFQKINDRTELSNSNNEKSRLELEQFWNFGQVLFRLKPE